MLKLAGRFFHELTDDAKDALHMRQSKQFRGYEPAEFSQVNAFTAKETKEAFNWGYEVGLDPTGGDGKYVELDGSVDGSPNIWPKESDLPGFYGGIAKYYGQVSLISIDGCSDKIGPSTRQASLSTFCLVSCPSRRILRSSHDTSGGNCTIDSISSKYETTS